MANPLTDKCRTLLDDIYGVYRIAIVGSSKSGHMDDICCYNGLFYGFEYKYKSDTPSEVQKEKINKCIDNGGRAYFIRSVDQLKYILDNDVTPTKYIINQNRKFSL